MIFSEKLAVIELFGSYGTNSLFPNLARGLSFQYGYLKSQPTKDSHQGLYADIIVDLSELQNLVASMH